MRVAVFSSKSYDRKYLQAANKENQHLLVFFDARLQGESAALALGFEAVCVFVNDIVDREVVAVLAKGGTRLLALRSAGFNHVDLRAASDHGLTVLRVPGYSPHAVAEHTVALILALNRKIHRAYSRVRDGNFSIDGLMGRDLCGQTVGIIGLGKVGAVFAQIMLGFGCRVLGHDPAAVEHPGVQAVSRDELFVRSHIISLHCPLRADTRHMIDGRAIELMMPGVMLINTSRGALIDTPAAIAGLKRGHIGQLGLDVYEEEDALFFEDHSGEVIDDDVFMRLVTFPNVLITAHQAFFTHEALTAIARTTIENISDFEAGRTLCSTVFTSERHERAE